MRSIEVSLDHSDCADVRAACGRIVFDMPEKEIVVMRRCRSYEHEEVYEACRGAIKEIGNTHRIFKRGSIMLLKPNMLSVSPPEAAATTHPSIIRALILLLRDFGCIPLVADSPAFGTLRQVARSSGIAEVCEQLNTPLFTWRSSVRIAHPFQANQSLIVGKEALEVDGIINIPKFKTHVQVGFSGAIKNMFGCVPGKRKTVMHMTIGMDEFRFADTLLSYCVALRPLLTVMDAVVAMHGNGPRKGEPYEFGAIIVSLDAIAVDAALTQIAKIPPSHQLLLEAARRRSLSSAFSDGIQIEGDKFEMPSKPFIYPTLIGTGFNPGRVVKSIIKNWVTMLTGRMPER